MWWLRELGSCTKFLRVTGAESVWESKRVYEFFIPLVITALFSLVFFRFPNAFDAESKSEIYKHIFQFTVFAVPFHLAALGAFATFKSDELEAELSGVHSKLRVWINIDNKDFYKPLKMRKYISLLFGYLCTLGVFYIFCFIIASNFDLKVIAGEHEGLVLDVGFILAIFFITHYSILTVYAVTFMFDKLNKIISE